MRTFIISFLASLLAFIIAIFICILLLVGLIVISIEALEQDKTKTEKISSPSILHIRLSEEITDKPSSPFEDFDFKKFEPSRKLTLYEYLSAIEDARENEIIKGIFLQIDPSFSSGMSVLYELRNALQNFKRSGKFIYTYGEIYSQKSLYLASVADSIFIHPSGLAEFKGQSYEGVFLKGLLKKLEIEPQIIRHGKFKSAIEPLILDKMSEENKLQIRSLLSATWEQYLKDVSASRNIPPAQLNEIADSVKVRKSEDAKKYQLVDALAFYDQVEEKLKQRIKTDKEEETPLITLPKYLRTINKKYAKEKIAILYAAGDIVDGEGESDEISPNQIIKEIKKISKDENIKAVILRVNSPGGSALASDIIWRELGLLKQKKPLIVSMSNVAASGGYYISCNADKILATPFTITGSIGVFGVIPNMQAFYNNLLGITFDTVLTHAHADLMTINRPLTDYEKKIIQEGVEKVYDDFVSKVAEGRKLSKHTVDSLGQGRVWSGTLAKKIGLVDEIGGLSEAIAVAKKLAHLQNKEVSIATYPSRKDFWESLFSGMESEVKHYLVRQFLQDEYALYHHLKSVKKMQGIQARCMVCGE